MTPGDFFGNSLGIWRELFVCNNVGFCQDFGVMQEGRKENLDPKCEASSLHLKIENPVSIRVIACNF